MQSMHGLIVNVYQVKLPKCPLNYQKDLETTWQQYSIIEVLCIIHFHIKSNYYCINPS